LLQKAQVERKITSKQVLRNLFLVLLSSFCWWIRFHFLKEVEFWKCFHIVIFVTTVNTDYKYVSGTTVFCTSSKHTYLTTVHVYL
jgi:hypothetical protein